MTADLLEQDAGDFLENGIATEAGQAARLGDTAAREQIDLPQEIAAKIEN
jgi:hypothetical protein